MLLPFRACRCLFRVQHRNSIFTKSLCSQSKKQNLSPATNHLEKRTEALNHLSNILSRKLKSECYQQAIFDLHATIEENIHFIGVEWRALFLSLTSNRARKWQLLLISPNLGFHSFLLSNTPRGDWMNDSDYLACHSCSKSLSSCSFKSQETKAKLNTLIY